MMMAEEVRVVVSQELEHICLVVEHLMVGHCKVMVLVEWAAASYAARFLVMRLIVGAVGHKHLRQTMQAE